MDVQGECADGEGLEPVDDRDRRFSRHQYSVRAVRRAESTLRIGVPSEILPVLRDDAGRVGLRLGVVADPWSS